MKLVVYIFFVDKDGKICCPVCNKNETFTISGGVKGLTKMETETIWRHVFDKHVNAFNKIYTDLQSNSTFMPRESVVS